MATKRHITVTVTNVPCSCGGTMEPFEVEGEYDASVELGIRAIALGTFMVLRCGRCGEVALPGRMLETLSNEGVLLLLGLDRRLSGAEARFLRKAGMALGQQGLAERLGVTRVTVARWEAEKSLSPEHDFALRSLVGHHLLKLGGLGTRPWSQRRGQLIKAVTNLDSAKVKAAPARPSPLRIAA